jgi:hypothetical protein
MAGADRISGGASEERLRRLEDQLDRASAAAERLMAEAAASAGGNREPPPAGWQIPEREDGRRDDELDALMALLRSLRHRIPPELQQRLVAALRELLEAVRALLDWYLERLERPRHPPAEVQDIPIL